MKKFLLTTMLAISTMVMQAQTYYNCSGIRLFTDGYVEFDFSNPNPLDSISLTVRDFTNNTDVSDIALYAQSATYGINTLYSFNSTYSSPITLSSNTYSIAMGHCYGIECDLPQSFCFYRYAHNPYPSFFIKLCAVSSSGEIMGLYNVAEIPLSTTMLSDCWFCWTNNVYETQSMYYHFDTYGLIPHRIQPTLDFEDLWYTEYDQVPRDPNWKQHSAFVSEIDHFIIGISFAS
ncbi:MAG: hypothetical protein K6E52_09260 [Bacteroidaceae bacterium]|nr:hypothetical protein [Bacteroidaceae bacterium]